MTAKLPPTKLVVFPVGPRSQSDLILAKELDYSPMPSPGPTSAGCTHANLQLEPSAYAEEAGFAQQPPVKRFAAATKSGRNLLLNERSGRDGTEARAAQEADAQLATFPGPLVLPWDDLGWEPEAEGQSFKSWHQEKARNKPTTARSTLYVVDVPEITPEVQQMRQWSLPKQEIAKRGISKSTGSDPAFATTPTPHAEDFVEYLATFYHGFSVKSFPQRLRFVAWEEKAKKFRRVLQQQHVGLATADGNTTRIRARPSQDGIFDGQLNLEDILDAAIAMLPRDAYAIVLLMDHDLYEDEKDDFCCGRAYGGSRVSVVSMSRYRPELDDSWGIDLAHMWPASHCQRYVAHLCAEQDIHNETRKVPAAATSPMRAAVRAASQTSQSNSSEYLKGLWFSRVARTVAHELGHCLCLDHCIYYACLMQSTSGIAEDVRQPPYLCPVCMSKISYKVAVELRRGSEDDRISYVRERYQALAGVCERWKHIGMFAGYQAWLEERLRGLNEAADS